MVCQERARVRNRSALIGDLYALHSIKTGSLFFGEKIYFRRCNPNLLRDPKILTFEQSSRKRFKNRSFFSRGSIFGQYYFNVHVHAEFLKIEQFSAIRPLGCGFLNLLDG